MSLAIELQVAKDHIEKITKVNALKAVVELVWNSLDADATEIHINTQSNPLGLVEEIMVKDNGVGMTYEEAINAFSKLGGSSKRNKRFSTTNRLLHGQAGQGRLKSMAIGDLVAFESVYVSDNAKRSFSVGLNRNKLDVAEFTEEKSALLGDETGVLVRINNVDQKKAVAVKTDRFKRDLESQFALYHSKYNNFNIYVDGDVLNFSNVILKEVEDSFKFEIDYIDVQESESLVFEFKIVEWLKSCSKRLYICNEAGVSYADVPLDVHTNGFPITMYVSSPYIDKLEQDNLLGLKEMDAVLQNALRVANRMAEKYIAQRLKEQEKKYIQNLKELSVYPFDGVPKSKQDQAVRTDFNAKVLDLQAKFPKINKLEADCQKLVFDLLKDKLAENKDYLDTYIKS